MNISAHRGSDSGLTMPGYGEFLLLQSMLAARSERIEFEAIIDSSPETPASKSWMEVVGAESFALPDGGTRDALRIDMANNSTVTSSHWVIGGEVVASDWVGARSYLKRSPEEALHGVEAKLADFVLNGATADRATSNWWPTASI